MGIVVKLQDKDDKTSLENGDKLLEYKEDQKYMLVFGPNENLEDKTLKIKKLQTKKVDKNGTNIINDIKFNKNTAGKILDAKCSEHYIVAHGSDNHAVKEFLTNFVDLLPEKTKLEQNMSKCKIILVVCNAVNRNHNAALRGSFLKLLLQVLLDKEKHEHFEVIAFDLYVGVRLELTNGNSFARVYVEEKIFQKDENGQFIFNEQTGTYQIESLKKTDIKQPKETDIKQPKETDIKQPDKKNENDKENNNMSLFDTSIFIVKGDGTICRILRRYPNGKRAEMLHQDESCLANVSNISGSKKNSNMTKIGFHFF